MSSTTDTLTGLIPTAIAGYMVVDIWDKASKMGKTTQRRKKRKTNKKKKNKK